MTILSLKALGIIEEEQNDALQNAIDKFSPERGIEILQRASTIYNAPYIKKVKRQPNKGLTLGSYKFKSK